MSLPKEITINDLDRGKFREVSSTPGTVAVAVTNPDGSVISGGGGGGATNITQVGGANIALGQTTKSASLPVTIATDDGVQTNLASIVANQTNNSQTSKVTDGTNSANVLKSDGTAAGQNALLAAGTYQSVPFSVTSVSNLTGIDAGNYSWVSVHIVTQYTGSTPTITWQGSNDNTNWVGLSLIQPLSTLSSGSLSTTVSGVIYAGPLNFRYFRLAFTGTYSSGTTAGTIELFSNPRQIVNINGQVSLNGTTSINTTSATGSAVPANAFYQAVNNGGNLTGISSAANVADAGSGGSTVDSAVRIYNGTTFDRIRSATAASNSSGTGLLGVGNLMLGASSNWQAVKSMSQAGDNGSTDSFEANGIALYNGSTMNFMRNNTTAAVIAAGATTSNAGVSVTTYNASKAVIIVNVSAVAGGTVTVAINGITSSGYSYPILNSTALGSIAVTPLRIFPGATASANAVANDMVPRTLQVVTTVTGTITYGVDLGLSV